MNTSGKKLSFWESLMLVAGAGIGTGILTIPYAINKIGVWGTLAALALAYAASLVLYLMIADLTLHSKDSSQLIGILREHLFTGRHGKLFSILFFIILALLLLQNLVVYIMCATGVLTELFGIGSVTAKIIFYILASAVILFGIKGVGIGEKYSVALIGTALLILTVLSFFNIRSGFSFNFGEPHLVLAVYGLFMFAFSAIFSIIQVCNNIKRRDLAKHAVTGGLTLNAILTLLFTASAILGSEEVTEIATIGLADSIGIPFVRIICAIFVILAMFSSFWSSGLAFADAIQEQFHLRRGAAWLTSTLPTLLIAIFLPLSVLDYVQIGAGALSLIFVIVALPAYHIAVRGAEGTLLLGRAARSKWLLVFTGVLICLMAVSSFIPID